MTIPSISITLNGDPVELPERATLSEMMRNLGRDPEEKGIAVALNDSVVRRALWPRTQLSEGDEVEIITAFQGG